MWIFTKHGFYSATLSPTKKGHIQMRARTRADLERLKRAFPEQLNQAKIIETPAAYYRWRIVMTPCKFTVVAMKLADEIDYGNFKNACSANGLDTHPHHAVWSIMMREQERERERERRRWRREALPGLRDWEADDEEPWEDPDGRVPAYGGDRDADALADLMEADQEPDDDQEDDGQCPDCRVEWVIEADSTGLHCPHCGHTPEYFVQVAANRRDAKA